MTVASLVRRSRTLGFSAFDRVDPHGIEVIEVSRRSKR